MNKELDLLKESLYETKGETFDVVCNRLIRKRTADLVLKLVLNNDKGEVIENLKKELMKIKFVEVTLANDPTYELESNIWNWFNKNVNQNVAIDIKVDPQIIGGAVISFDGKFFDGSVSSHLDNVLRNYV